MKKAATSFSSPSSATLTNDDVVFATVVKGNISIASLRLSGFSDIRELVSHITSTLRDAVSGIVTLRLRNATFGWTTALAVNIAATALA